MKGTVFVALHWKFELCVGGWRVFANATMFGTEPYNFKEYLCICILVQQCSRGLSCWKQNIFFKRKNVKSSALNNSTLPIAIQPGTWLQGGDVVGIRQNWLNKPNIWQPRNTYIILLQYNIGRYFLLKKKTVNNLINKTYAN